MTIGCRFIEWDAFETPTVLSLLISFNYSTRFEVKRLCDPLLPFRASTRLAIFASL
jgi:hypothetical protein